MFVCVDVRISVFQGVCVCVVNVYMEVKERMSFCKLLQHNNDNGSDGSGTIFTQVETFSLYLSFSFSPHT